MEIENTIASKFKQSILSTIACSVITITFLSCVSCSSISNSISKLKYAAFESQGINTDAYKEGFFGHTPHIEGGWKVLTDKIISGYSILELIPKGQNENNWQKMVTTEFHSYRLFGPDAQMQNIRWFMNIRLNILRQTCPMLKSKILQESNDDIIYQWSIKNCGHGMWADQIEYVRLKKGKYGVAALRYTDKSYHISPSLKQEVLTMLKNAYVEHM